MKTSKERAERLAKSWWESGRKGGRAKFVGDIERAIDEAVAAERKECEEEVAFGQRNCASYSEIIRMIRARSSVKP